MTALWLRVALPLGFLTVCCIPDAGSQQSETTEGSYPLREQSMERSSNSGGDRQSHQDNKSRTSGKQVSGKIGQVKKVFVRDTGQEYLVVLLGTTQGHVVVADLGPTEQFRDVELWAGDWISIRGPVGQVNGRHVIFAREINVDGDIIRVDRQMSSQHAHRSTKAVTGQVAIIKELTIKRGDESHQIVRIVTKDGKQIVADLGKKASLQDLNLAYGQEISVEGPMARLSGKPFVLAQKVTSQDKTVHIERKVLSAMRSVREGKGSEKQASNESPSQKIRGEVVMKGEVLNIDRDGFYIVKEPNGREVHLLVAEDLNVGLHVGDQVLAQVAPDGYVTTISKASDDQSESAPIYSGGYFDDGLYDDDWYFDYYELQAVSGSRRSNQERLREYEAGQMYEEAEESGIFNF